MNHLNRFLFWQVIQNYGHGGSGNDQTEDVNAFKRLTGKYFNGYIGLTTFYGCALKVANLLQGTLASEHYLSSKLWYNQEEKRCPAFLNKALRVFYVIRVFSIYWKKSVLRIPHSGTFYIKVSSAGSRYYQFFKWWKKKNFFVWPLDRWLWRVLVKLCYRFLIY